MLLDGAVSECEGKERELCIVNNMMVGDAANCLLSLPRNEGDEVTLM